MVLEEIEGLLNEESENWNQKTLEKIILDERIIKKISELENLKEFYDELSVANQDFAIKYIYPSLLAEEIREGKLRTSNEIKKYEDSDKTLPKDLLNLSEELRKENNPFLSLLGYLIFINYSEKEEILEKKEEIHDKILECLSILNSQDINQYFYVDSEFFDLFFPIENLFFELTEERILSEEEEKKIENFQKEIEEFTLKMAQEFSEQLRKKDDE